jgi:RNA 3'-terminal phosphate cyclase (ATP)
MGEGGGQLLRSSLALSLLTSTPFRITKIRAGRARPGLMRQHLMAVHAAATISDAETSGAELGSTALEFRPKAIRGGDYRFAIGGAGSSTLVFQTVLLPLLLGSAEPSTLSFEGGTHNPMAPPFDFLARTFLPLLSRMGARVEVELHRYGFYPAGGGSWSATVYPAPRLERLELLERGDIKGTSARALVASIPASVGLRELEALSAALGWERTSCRPLMISDSRGPGNALLAVIESEQVTEVVTGFGDRGVPAERVAGLVAEEVRRYLAAGVPVGEHLADQLLLPMALGQGGCFRTLEPSLHCTTQAQLLQLFVGTVVSMTPEAAGVWRIELESRKTLAGRDLSNVTLTR